MTTRDPEHIADTREQPSHFIEVSAQDDMSIPLRRGDAGETSGAGDPQLDLDGPTNRRPRRFSEGIERKPPPPANLRVGRFSDGLERSPRSPASRHIGNFADGIARHPDAAWERRIGSFADGYECLGEDRRT